MSESDLYKDESTEWTLAQVTPNIDFHLRKLMEISGALESEGMRTTAFKMREHIHAMDGMFSLMIDDKNNPEIERST